VSTLEKIGAETIFTQKLQVNLIQNYKEKETASNTLIKRVLLK